MHKWFPRINGLDHLTHSDHEVTLSKEDSIVMSIKTKLTAGMPNYDQRHYKLPISDNSRHNIDDNFIMDDRGMYANHQENPSSKFIVKLFHLAKKLCLGRKIQLAPNAGSYCCGIIHILTGLNL